MFFPPSPSEKRIASVPYLVPQPQTIASSSGTKILSCAAYSEPDVHAAILLLKKHGNPTAAKLLATLLTDVLLEELSERDTWNPKQTVIIPMPMSAKRKRQRGFNHVAKICTFLPRELQDRVVTTALIQTKHVPMQKTLTREERFTNVRGIFTFSHKEKIEGAHIVVIDDVVTTGATLDEATRTLQQEGFEVTAVALARA